MKEKKKKKDDLKEEKIKGILARKILRAIFWVIIGFVFLRGLVALFSMGNYEKERLKVESYMSKLESQEEIKDGAKGFSESFVRELFTYNKEIEDDYEERLRKYLSSGISFEKSTAEIEALTVNAVDISYKNSEVLDVDVVALIQYPEGLVKAIKVRVPLSSKNGKFSVTAMPQFIPDSMKAELDKYQKDFFGSEASDSVKAELETVLSNFFKTYYEGNENELSYYITEDFPFKNGLNGAVKFDEIKSLRAYDNRDKGYFEIGAEISVEDIGRKITQEIYLEVIKDGSRYYIKDISTR